MGGRLWKTSEERILREIWHDERKLELLTHLLPGRSAESMRTRGAVLGLGRRYVEWTEQEDETVRTIWAMDCPIKSQLALLPNRCWRSVVNRGRMLGLPARTGKQIATHHSWVDSEIIDALENSDVPLSAHDIAARSEASYVRITQVLRAYAEEKWRVVDWRHMNPNGTGNWTAYWVAGPGKNAAKPTLKARSASGRDYRNRRKVACGRINPFASIAGLVPLPQGQTGRIYAQDMSVKDEEELAA